MDSVCRRGATLPGCVTVQRWLAMAYFAHPMYLQYAQPGQTNHMSTKTTHDVYHPTRRPAPGTAWGRMCSPFIAIYGLPQPLPPV